MKMRRSARSKLIQRGERAVITLIANFGANFSAHTVQRMMAELIDLPGVSVKVSFPNQVLR